MAFDYFGRTLAVDPDTGNVVSGATAQVFATTDTGFASPLPILDMTGSPISLLIASDKGVYPAFQCPGYHQVIAKSGGNFTPLTSLLGSLLSVIPDPSIATDALALVAEAGEYRLVPRNQAEGLPPDPTLAPEGAGLIVTNGVMQWVIQQAGIVGAPPQWPNEFPPALHSHLLAQIADATAIGRALLGAVSPQTARQAIGAGTGNGTSDLTIGTTAGTAAAGNHAHPASAVTFTPVGSITATNLQEAVAQAASMGGGGGGGTSQVQALRFSSGQYPAFPTSKPAGVVKFELIGPVVPTNGIVSGGIPAYVGNGASQIPAQWLTNPALT